MTARDSAAWLALDNAHVAQSPYRPPLVLERGEGCVVWDVEGRRFLDFESGQFCMSTGHGHPHVAAAGQLLVFRPGDAITVAAGSEARVVLVGGAALEGPRYIWWNFVSSRKERIEQAKAEWKERRFDIVPGDEIEFIPLPE